MGFQGRDANVHSHRAGLIRPVTGVYIQALNLSHRLALLSDDRIVPVTHLFDNTGQETATLTDAVAFVCGRGDLWIADLIANYSRSLNH